MTRQPYPLRLRQNAHYLVTKVAAVTTGVADIVAVIATAITVMAMVVAVILTMVAIATVIVTVAVAIGRAMVIKVAVAMIPGAATAPMMKVASKAASGAIRSAPMIKVNAQIKLN